MRCGCPFFGKCAVYGLLAITVCVSAVGCGGGAGQPAVATSAGGAAPTRSIVRTLRVVALVDTSYRKLPRFADRLRGVIAGASAVLERQFGLALRLERVAPWTQPPADAEAVLDRLEREGVAADADWVVAFSARPPPRRARMPQVAASRYTGRYAALTSLGRFVPEGGEPLRQAEIRALLHAFGRAFGALPGCDRGIMAPGIGGVRAAHAFGPTNRALITAHLTLPLSPPDAALRISAEIADDARMALGRPGPDVDCDRPGIEARRRLLGEVVMMASTARDPRADVSPPEPAPDADAEVVRAAEAEVDARPGPVWAACRSIAERRPQVGARCAGRAAEALDRPEEAQRYLRAWLAHHPDDEDSILRLARLVGRGGDDEAARALLADAVEQHPSFVEARVNLGIALARLGDFAGARAAWQAVLDRDPDHADARALLDQLPD